MLTQDIQCSSAQGRTGKGELYIVQTRSTPEGGKKAATHARLLLLASNGSIWARTPVRARAQLLAERQRNARHGAFAPMPNSAAHCPLTPHLPCALSSAKYARSQICGVQLCATHFLRMLLQAQPATSLKRQPLRSPRGHVHQGLRTSTRCQNTTPGAASQPA